MQGISQDQARQQVADMQQKYTAALEKTREQAKVAADATAKTVSKGAIIGAVALLTGALAAFFACPGIDMPGSLDGLQLALRWGTDCLRS